MMYMFLTFCVIPLPEIREQLLNSKISCILKFMNNAMIILSLHYTFSCSLPENIQRQIQAVATVAHATVEIPREIIKHSIAKYFSWSA